MSKYSLHNDWRAFARKLEALLEKVEPLERVETALGVENRYILGFVSVLGHPFIVSTVTDEEGKEEFYRLELGQGLLLTNDYTVWADLDWEDLGGELVEIPYEGSHALYQIYSEIVNSWSKSPNKFYSTQETLREQVLAAREAVEAKYEGASEEE